MEPVVLTNSSGLKRIFWNLTANVGVRSPNQREDVQFVQFGYFAMANSSKNQNSQLKAVFAAVQIGAEYSGQEDDPLTRAIRAHQKERGGVQDGHVSVMRSILYSGTTSFMAIALNNNLLDLIPDYYPRLDRHPKCPPRVREAVLRHCTL
ncbi:MAG: hypothetical protein GY873_18790 [Bosea sp.]|uniref:hypothetical protein n=1 Tax=Bosea sp. (in: a-proteobacteria) TaxID=1871050 RepID=UPI002390CA5A|nr:hypothetical protein [Bosea sp. (in: a-proteobacteria)]MCP4736231.1 hypothetical protein [Bosea sp. (in: a-proteobacteria)]